MEDYYNMIKLRHSTLNMANLSMNITPISSLLFSRFSVSLHFTVATTLKWGSVKLTADQRTQC